MAIACGSFTGSDAPGTDGKDAQADVPATIPDAAITTDAGDGGAASRYRDEVMKDQPVGYWRLGEPAGSPLAKDEMGLHDGLYSPAGNTLMLGAAGALANDPDTATNFDGNGHVNVGNFFDFANNVSFSIELWVKPSATNDSYRRLISKETTDGYNIQVAPNGNLGFAIFADGGPNVDGGIGIDVYATLEPKVYTHVVAFYDTVAIQLYVNGALVKTKTGAVTTKPRTDPFVIGGASYLTQIGDARGGIDEVAVYDKALSPARIVAHYLAGHSAQ